MLAGLPLAAGVAGPAFGREAGEARLIGRLIGETREITPISQRIDAISKSLLGIRYQSNTLIGGPNRQEVFVVRDDAFDCVTFCEVVLAVARAGNLDEFKSALLQIRYLNGRVQWDERNHYFAQWSRRAVENRICRPVSIGTSVPIDKDLNWSNYGRRRVSLHAVSAAALLAGKAQLASGDVIGFVSMRPNLDFYHTGLVVVGKGRTLMLRHASQSRRRVLDERMEDFVAANGVKYVTLLRPADPAQA